MVPKKDQLLIDAGGMDSTPLSVQDRAILGVVIAYIKPRQFRLKGKLRDVFTLALLLCILSMITVFPLGYLNSAYGWSNSLVTAVVCFGIPVFGVVAGICIWNGRLEVDYGTKRTIRVGWFRRKLYDGVIAIQLIPCRADENLRHKHPGYQINFILDDANRSRVGCITFHDAAWVRQVGRALAEYLGVSLVDQLPAGY